MERKNSLHILAEGVSWWEAELVREMKRNFDQENTLDVKTPEPYTIVHWATESSFLLPSIVTNQ